MSVNPANKPTPPPVSPASSGEALRVLAGMAGRSAKVAAKTGPDGGMLTVIPQNCIGCRTCELTCSFVHSNSAHLARSRIKVHEVTPGIGIPLAPIGEPPADATRSRVLAKGAGHIEEPRPGVGARRPAASPGDLAGPEKRCVQMTCLQCAEAACVIVCPVDALARNESTGAIEVNEDRCVGCALCEKACPFGHMHFDSASGLAVKCDLCKGEPMCARFCPNRALEVR